MTDHEIFYNNGIGLNVNATQNGTPAGSENDTSSMPNHMYPDFDPGFTYPDMDPGFTFPNSTIPGVPTTPSIPTIPGTPTTPSMPVMPGTPTTPSLPVMPGTPTTPSIPVIPGTPTTPSIPVIPGTPTTPSLPNIPVTPNLPPTDLFPPNRPVAPLPPNGCINCPPMTPSPQYYGKVRFLNASTTGYTVNIAIDGNNYAINSRFGTITNYDWVADGFHTVTVRSTSGMRNILYQATFPFVANEKTTMILVDIGASFEMVKVVDTGCVNMPFNTGCYRVANMSFTGSSYDVSLYGGDTVFRNVTFQNVTNYKQAIAGSYQFYVTNSGSFSVIREMPVIVVGTFPSASSSGEPLLSIQVDIRANTNYTTYLIGNNWSEYGFRALTVTD